MLYEEQKLPLMVPGPLMWEYFYTVRTYRKSFATMKMHITLQ